MKNTFLLLLLIFVSCKNENKGKMTPEKPTAELKSISLSYTHSLSSANLIVSIQNYQRDNINVFYKYVPKGASNPNDYEFKSYEIDSTKYDKIVESILKIDRANIEKESETIGHDGISTSISFYEKDRNTINNVYNIWTPNYDTENRKLNDYMETYIELIKLAHMEPDSLF